MQGGGQNGTPQGNQQVNELVGNSEQLSSSEIPNYQSVAGLEGYSTSEILDLVKGHIFEALGEDVRIVDMRIIGSRTNGTNNADSDLDVLVEYEGEISEDSFFNAVNDEEGALYIDGIRVDINPITKDKSGSIEQWMNRNKGYSKAEGNAPGQSGVYADNQGNPVDADGKLIVDEVNSIDEITDEDFETPTRSVQLPAIPENVANAIGTNGRPVIIKKNVFEKNGNTHVELEPEDSRNILRSALYNPNLVGSTQPIRRPDYKVAIRTGEQNAVVVLDVYQEKDFVEIVGWRMVNEKGLAKMQRQAEREGGQFLILSPNDGSAAALSALPLGLSSASEGTTQSANSQENAQESGEIAENGGEKQPRSVEEDLDNGDLESQDDIEEVVSADYAIFSDMPERTQAPAVDVKINGKIETRAVELSVPIAEHLIRGNTAGQPSLAEYYDEAFSDEELNALGVDKETLPEPGDHRVLWYSNNAVYIDFNGGAYPIPAIGIKEFIDKRINEGKYIGIYKKGKHAVINTQQSTSEIQEPVSVEDIRPNGDKRITNYNSRGEVATVATERDGKIVSVDSYDEGVLFEHTEYDGNGKATSVTRYEREGNVVGTQAYENGKLKGESGKQSLVDRVLARAEEKRRMPLRERAKELEAQVGVKANIIESLDEVKNREARKRIAAGEAVAGWYSGGQVYLYMPNIKDKREIELTYVHEVVAHHGVKKLLGDRFNEFLDGVWNMMSEADRARMLAYVGANENPTLQDMRAAADEYVAELAEKMNLGELEQSTWEKIVDWFKKILENIGFKNLTKEDIESMLKASYSNLKAESGKGKTGSTENAKQTKAEKYRKMREDLEGLGVFGEVALPKGYKWSDGKKYGGKGGRKTDVSSITALVIGDDLYLRDNQKMGGIVPFVNLNNKNHQTAVIRNFRQWPSIGDFMTAVLDVGYQFDRVTEDAINEIFTQNGIGFNRSILRPMFRISRTSQEFDATQAEAVEKRGIVAPGLNEAVVNVVDVPRHNFTGRGRDAIHKAEKWANENIAKEHTYHEGQEDEFKYTIDEDAISKFLSSSSTGNSENLGVHLAALKELPNIIDNSVEVEVHPDYQKKDGVRSADNGVGRDDMLVHRLYGAVNIDGRVYRAKTTIHEFRDKANKAYDYKITEIELIVSGPSTDNARTNSTSVTATKLLEGVEKSYDKGKKVLDESENSSENPQDSESGIRFRKKDSERRQEKRRINDIIDTAAGFVTVGGKKQATKNRLKKEAERKQLAKEMYSSVLKGDFNDVTLSQIDKFIEDATPANPFGRRISQRLPQRMERALRQGARTNAVDALFSRICESTVPANERFSEAGRREIEERKKELLKGWAIATGNWHTDLKEFTDDTEPIGEGKDSKVYMSKDGNSVIKASKGKPFGKKFRPDIDNIPLFNDVFKNSRYEILGYGEIDGQFVRILKQDFIDFAESTPLTQEERKEYMGKLGFKPLNKDYTAFSNGEIVIADLQKSNIVKDAAGNISVIDADAKLHTKDVGGDYTYPPVEEDLPEQETRFRTIGGNSGYVGYSMSKRAAEAREEGRYPKTDFKKEYGVSGKSFDLLQKAGIIYNSEWHHTSKFGNRTDFYSWDEPEFAEYYAANKKRIDKAINEVEKLKPEYNEFKAIDKYLSEGRSQSEVRDLVDEDLRRIEPAEKAYNDARSKLIEQLKDEFYDLPEDSGTRFRIANENQEVFVSNAQRAVEGIQQNKATAEQWIAMLKKNGGLKAGEDAWMGLEEWLNERGKVKGENGKVDPSAADGSSPKTGAQSSVTKQEVLDFIAQNRIQIEEVQYGESVEGISEETVSESEEFGNLAGSLIEYDEEGYPYVDRERFEQLRNEDEDFLDGFSIDYWGEGIEVNDPEAAARYLGLAEGSKLINSTRLNYTTEGLDNKREIALTVPTVESWNESDEIHFGDAGKGRAVAWVRFGETTDSEGNRVLVIDEIQSKRHQEGREKGYKDAKLAELDKKLNNNARSTVEELDEVGRISKERYDYIISKIGDEAVALDNELTELLQKAKELGTGIRNEEAEKQQVANLDVELEGVRNVRDYDRITAEIEDINERMAQRRTDFNSVSLRMREVNTRIDELINNYVRSQRGAVDAAPFEKNWHELAMKRMLRLAAEEGFDKVAWTTGEQQAERYNLSKQVGGIEVRRDNGERHVITYDPQGNPIWDATGVMTPEEITETFGKELGGKILAVESGKRETITGDNLRIGGEGMKGFYDKMLPSFVQKYTKKWGAKVGEVTMPSLEENNTMWSVDVTPEMQESVMEGQTMFRITPEMDAEYMSAVENGDMDTAERLVKEAARLAGYISDTSYQGTKAFNGAAPSSNGYFETKEERANAWNEGEFDDTASLGDYADNDIDVADLNWRLTDRGNYRRATQYEKESIDNINEALRNLKRKIKIYRAVPADIKEGTVRNGDWITPSRSYAEYHIGLQDWTEGRVIEQEVDIDDIWWDGNDINEWGYDDGSNYVYRNTKNNRKLLAPVTYDNEGNVIPLSERFNEEKEDIRFRFIGEKGAANLDNAEEATTRLDNLAVAREMETAGKEAKAIKLATGWERGADGKWRYETPDELDFNLKAEGNKLMDYLNAPELYAAYPELKDAKFEWFTDASAYGEYDGQSNTLRLNSRYALERGKSTLAHEIQHAIQEIEGFARGGNPRVAGKVVRENLPERHARAYGIVHSYGDMSLEQAREWANNPDAELIGEAEPLRSLLADVDAGMVKWEDIPKWFSSDLENYESLAGEVESRNVQERLGMSPEERRNKLAEETEDVRRKDQIFIYDALGSASEGGNMSYDEAEHEAKIFEQTHKGSAPIIVLDGIDNWESEFIKAGVKKDEIERFRERLKTSPENPKAAYLDDADLIFIFSPKVARKEFNGYIWHENMHKAIREDDRFNRDIAERIINTVIPGGYQEAIEYFNKHGYEGLAADEEALCQILQVFYINGAVSRKGFKGKGVIQDYFNPLIDKIYGRRDGQDSNLGNRSIQAATHGTDGTKHDGGALATPVEQRAGRESETETQATGATEPYSDGRESTRFRTVEEGTGGSIDDIQAQPLTLMERITNSLLEVSANVIFY